MVLRLNFNIICLLLLKCYTTGTGGENNNKFNLKDDKFQKGKGSCEHIRLLEEAPLHDKTYYHTKHDLINL